MTASALPHTNYQAAQRDTSIQEANLTIHRGGPDLLSTSSRALVKDPKPKLKVKTRPLEATGIRLSNGVANVRLVDQQVGGASTVETIGVKPKTMNFFKQMFSCEELHQQHDWDHLVAAMIDAGCSAVHNGGSAVTFEDVRNRKGSLILHKPHPKTTVYPIMLRSIGYRLTKRLGWDALTFVEADKGSVE